MRECLYYGVMIKKVVIILVFVMVASLCVAGCTAKTTSPTSTPTPSPTMLASVSSPIPTATVKPTATASPDYSSTINNNPSWSANGYTVSSQFHKTTVDGRNCFVGSISKMGYTFQVQVFPMNSYTDALSYRDKLINDFKAQGYTTSSISGDQWSGTSGNMGAWAQAYETSIIGVPMAMAWGGNIAG
jgi:hypothetical protein